MKAASLNTNSALWTSAILHLGLLVAFFLITLVKSFLPKEPVHVFEMIREPISENSMPGDKPEESVSEPVPNFELPDVKPLKIPDPVIPEPEIVEDPVEPVVEQAVKPVAKPAVKPSVTAEKEKLVSFEDFIKKNPKQAKPRKSQPSSNPNIKAPTINTEKYSANLASKLTTVNDSATSSMSAAERTALQRYGDLLHSRLNSAWIKPESLSGLNLMATVVFDVSSSGRITNIRFQPGSGNASFDESIRAAFLKVASGGPTPTGQGHTFTMSFRMIN